MRWPSIKDVAAELRVLNETEAEEVDEEGELYGVDARLQVLPNGSWQLWWGSPDFDTDHRGYWGATTLPGNNQKFDSTGAARDLIDQAKEMHAQDTPANNPSWTRVLG